jgi:hypothetical protein
MSSRPHPRGRALSRASLSLLAALLLVLSTSVAVGVAYGLHRQSVTQTVSGVPKYLVVIVLDGGETSYLHMDGLPHLDALRAGGVEYEQAFAGILESETPSGHATLATGSTPARDGLLGFNWITDDNDTVHLFSPDVVRQGAIEHVMQRAGAPTIASLFKQKYPGSKVVAISGHKYYAADPLGGPNADYILYYAPDAKGRYVPTAIPGHVPPQSVLTEPSLISASTTMGPGEEDTLTTNLAIHTFQQVHQRVTLINLPEFDWPLGHVDGGDPTKAQVLMQAFDRNLGSLEDAYRKAGVLDQTAFVITADHGMAPLKYQIPDEVLDTAVTKAGTTSPETTYATAGYIWLQNPAVSQTVAANVVAARDPHVQSVYYKVHASGGDHYVHLGGMSIPPVVDGANQYLLKSFLGGNAPDVVAFCTENAAFVKHGAESWKGNHGGGSWESQHMPLLFAGPGFAHGVISRAPARLEDVAPTALSALGVTSTGMEGSVLADALGTPTSVQTANQTTLNRELGPVVNALAAQSEGETAAQGSG